MPRARPVLVAGTVFYSAWLLTPLLGSRLSPLTSYVSEAAADGQPYAPFIRATDLLAGVAFVLAAALYRRSCAAPQYAGIALLGVAIAGAATVADALLPLACTPTADATCRAAEAAGTVPLTHTLHAVSSGIAGFGGVLAVLGWVLWRRSGPGFDGAVPALGVGLAYLAATGWTLAAMLAPALYLGVAQRAQLVAITLWLLLASRPPRGRPRRSPRPTDRGRPAPPRR